MTTAAPLTKRETYHNWEITIVFRPATNDYSWTAARTHTITLDGHAQTLDKARTDAHKSVDAIRR